MNVSVFQRIQVKDFDTWVHPDPNAVAEIFKGQGALSMSLTRNLDDPNALMVHMQFADDNAAKAFVEWYEKAAVEWYEQDPNTAQDIQEWWLGTDVEGFCRDL